MWRKIFIASFCVFFIMFTVAQSYPSDNRMVVLMGDSIMYGMQYHLEKDIHEKNKHVSVIKTGRVGTGLVSKHSGYERIARNLSNKDQKPVGIVCFGINDVAMPINGDKFMSTGWRISYYVKLVTLRAHFSKFVFVLPPLTKDYEFNKMLALVREFIKTSFIDDNDTLVLDFDPMYMNQHEPDGIHLTDAGYRRMSRYITSKIDF